MADPVGDIDRKAHLKYMKRVGGWSPVSVILKSPPSLPAHNMTCTCTVYVKKSWKTRLHHRELYCSAYFG